MRLPTIFRTFLSTSLMATSVSMALAASVPFEQQKFDTSVAAGDAVVVEFSAPWCPTCRAQKPIVAQIMAQPKFQGVTLFVADYDKEVALKNSSVWASKARLWCSKGARKSPAPPGKRILLRWPECSTKRGDPPLKKGDPWTLV